jgi:hypothetical protein
MSTFEKLYAVATGLGETMDQTRALIGEQKLALALAKAALIGTSETLSPTIVSEVFGISKSAASDRINSIAVKE